MKCLQKKLIMIIETNFHFLNKKQKYFYIFYFFPCVSLIYIIIKYNINTDFVY